MLSISPRRSSQPSSHVNGSTSFKKKETLQPLPPGIIDQPISLENTWSIWFDRYKGAGLTVEEYAASLHQLGSFDTIQSFWRWYNNLPLTNKLRPRDSYHLMKNNIRPRWEDPANVGGGSFSIRVPKSDTDAAWLQVLLATVGEQFSRTMNEKDDICGVTVSIRRDENLITVWHRNATQANVFQFSAFIRSLLPNIRLQPPTYKVHQNEENFKADSAILGKQSH